MKRKITDVDISVTTNDHGQRSLWVTIARGDRVEDIHTYPVFFFQQLRSYRRHHARAFSMQDAMLTEAILARAIPTPPPAVEADDLNMHYENQDYFGTQKIER